MFNISFPRIFPSHCERCDVRIEILPAAIKAQIKDGVDARVTSAVCASEQGVVNALKKNSKVNRIVYTFSTDTINKARNASVEHFDTRDCPGAKEIQEILKQ